MNDELKKFKEACDELRHIIINGDISNEDLEITKTLAQDLLDVASYYWLE